MTRKPFVLALVGACTLALSGLASAQDRVSATQKGSLLIFSKVEIKWDGSGNLIQDTILDVTNDYPADVAVQAYFINGDIELAEVRDSAGNIVQAYEPGWNTADCRFELTGNQPHFWSAAHGSDKCQAFTVLDPDGPGRPDPETNGATNILRGYVIMYAVDFFAPPVVDGSAWAEIHWNHLKGDAAIVNYANGSAWEYNAWAFQAISGSHGDPTGTANALRMDGSEYELPYANLILDFYATGSEALSGGGQTVMIDTDVTLHAVSADLRQDGCGPILTKVEAEIWNEFESKFSGTRRCICCWDQTMLSDWVRSVAIPNHFTRERLGTDKGKARLDGVASTECDYEALCGETATAKRYNNGCVRPVGPFGVDNSDNAAILGLATKFLSFTPSDSRASAGVNLHGAGTEPAVIRVDRMAGPQELESGRTTSSARGDVKSGRTSTTRGTIERPAE